MSLFSSAHKRTWVEASALHQRIERSVPSLLVERTNKRPRDIAFYEKHLGIYQEHSWASYAAAVEEVALGLAALKVELRERVAVIGDTCSEWLIADQAIMAIGAITVGVYATSAPFEVRHILTDLGAAVVIVETQEHMDKLLEVLPALPAVRNFIVIDTRALFRFEHPLYLSFEQLRALGRERARRAPAEFAEAVAAVRPDDLATILYTSGTTDKAKGVMVSHRTLLAAAESYVHCNPRTRSEPHRVVANMPLAHGVGRSVISHVPLISEITPFFGDEVESFTETVREVAPNFALLPPRYWEKFAAQLIVSVETSTALKRRAYSVAARVGKSVVKRRYAGQSIPLHLRLGYWLAYRLVFSQMLEKIGLGRMKIAFTGSAPMPPQVTQIWHIWGIDLREMYGLTECLAISIAQFSSFPRPGDIGRPTDLEGFEFRLSNDNEMMLRSPAVCQGYWQQPDKSAEVFGRDGWLRTGDVAEITAEGAIRLVDRKKEIIVTAGGKTSSPQQIEKALKGSSYIAEAVAIGEGRRYVTALLMLDYTTVSEWARANKVAYTSYTNLVTRPEVADLIEREVAQANEFLARVEQVKYFRIIPQELDPEEGETTPNYKIKRKLIAEMFGELIEFMYEARTRELFQRAVDI